MANTDARRASRTNLSKQHLEECIRHLQNAKSDTEKFAGLLLLTKAVKATDCSTTDRERIFAAVGFSFFNRLLKTKKVPEGCSPLAYRSLALSILASLTQDPNIACWAEMKQILPHVKQILSDSISTEAGLADTLSSQVMEDSLGIVSSLVSTAAGGQMLLDSGYPATLVQTLASRLAEGEEERVKILAVLAVLQQQFGVTMWKDSGDVFREFLSFLAQAVVECKDKALLDRCQLAAFFVDCAPKIEELLDARCVQQLLKKLSSMLRSKLGVSQRQQVLCLVQRLVVCLGVQCLLPPVVSDDKLLPLFLHLTCVEVRLAVENSTAEQMQENRDSLALHYTTMECLLHYLCASDEDEDLPLDPTVFVQAHDALLNAVNGVFYLLLQVNSGAMKLPLLDPLIVASVRLIAVFTTQAFDEVKDNFLRLLPFLVKLCETVMADQNTPISAMSQTLNRPAYGAAVGEPSEQKSPETAALTDGESQRNVSEVSDPVHLVQCENISEDVGSESDSAQQASSIERNTNSTTVQGVSNQQEPNSKVLELAEQVDHVLLGDSSDAIKSDSPAGQSGETIHSSHSPTDNTVHNSTAQSEVLDTDGGVSHSLTPLDAGGDAVEGDYLPKDLPGFMKLIERRPRHCAHSLPVEELLEVVRLLVPVFDVMCDDEEARRAFVEHHGSSMLVQFLIQTQRRLGAMTDGESKILEQKLQADVVVVLVNLIDADQSLQQTEPYLLLLDFALDTVSQWSGTQPVQVSEGPVIAAGLCLLAGGDVRLSDGQRAKLNQFLRRSVAYVCDVTPRMFLVDMSEEDKLLVHRDCVQNIWMVIIRNLNVMLGKADNLAAMFLELSFIPMVAKLLTQQQDWVTDKSSATALMDIVLTLAETDPQAKKLLKSHKDIGLAR